MSKIIGDFEERYPSYDEREKAKKQFYLLLNEPNASLWEKGSGMLHWQIWSHYWRAREALEDSTRPKTFLKKIRGSNYYPGYVLDIDHYAENWLWSMGDYEPFCEFVKEVEKQFCYKPVKNKYMRKGEVYYRLSENVGPTA